LILTVEIYGWDIISQELCHQLGNLVLLHSAGLTNTCPNARAAKLTEDGLNPVKVDSN
jgi:hypothetical protein